ncbi:MAG: hypothetical protein O3A21_09875, partial [Proteobacteria bacterium]|nr:hypothetical protein [Pseudomonadota bacterium]
LDPARFDPLSIPWQELRAGHPPIANKLRLAMLVYGVDINGWPGGMISAVNTDDDFDWTVDAFRRAIHDMKEEGDL